VSALVLDGTESLMDHLARGCKPSSATSRAKAARPRSPDAHGPMLALRDMVRRRLIGKQGMMKWLPCPDEPAKEKLDEDDLLPLNLHMPTKREKSFPALKDADEDDLPLSTVFKRRKVSEAAAAPGGASLQDGRRIKTLRNIFPGNLSDFY